MSPSAARSPAPTYGDAASVLIVLRRLGACRRHGCGTPLFEIFVSLRIDAVLLKHVHCGCPLRGRVRKQRRMPDRARKQAGDVRGIRGAGRGLCGAAAISALRAGTEGAAEEGVISGAPLRAVVVVCEVVRSSGNAASEARDRSCPELGRRLSCSSPAPCRSMYSQRRAH